VPLVGVGSGCGGDVNVACSVGVCSGDVNVACSVGVCNGDTKVACGAGVSVDGSVGVFVAWTGGACVVVVGGNVGVSWAQATRQSTRHRSR